MDASGRNDAAGTTRRGPARVLRGPARVLRGPATVLRGSARALRTPATVLMPRTVDNDGLGDLTNLYVELAARLETSVRCQIQAPRAVIEDACQFAWSRLVYHRDRVRRETVFAWLAKTAVREALKALARQRRESSLEEELEQRGERRHPALVDVHETVHTRERIQSVAALPPRQARAVWLQALGLSRQEMAAYERCTERTVQRQLVRARRALRTTA